MESKTQSKAEEDIASTKKTTSMNRGAKRLSRINLVIVLLGALVSVYWQQEWVTISFLLGGLLTTANLKVLSALVFSLTGTQEVKKGKLIAQVLLKLFLSVGALAAIMVWIQPMPIPFLLGLSSIVLAVIVEGFLGFIQS